MTTQPADPSPPSFRALPEPELGSVRIVGTNMPNGVGTLTRTDASGTMLVRGGVGFQITNGAFVVDDPEAMFDTRTSYHLSVEVDDPVIARNLVLNPSAEVDLASWGQSSNRTLTRVQATTARPAAVGTYFFSASVPAPGVTPDFLALTTAQQLLPETYAAVGSIRLTPGQNTDHPGLTNFITDSALRTPAAWQTSGTGTESRLAWQTGGGVILSNLRPFAGEDWRQVKATYATWQAAITAHPTWLSLINTGPGITPPDIVMMSALLDVVGRGKTVTIAVRGPISGMLIVHLLDGTRFTPVATVYQNVTTAVQLIDIPWPSNLATARIGLAPARQQSVQIDQIGVFYDLTPEQRTTVPFSGDTPGHFWMGAKDASMSAVYVEESAQVRLVIVDNSGQIAAIGESATVNEHLTQVASGPMDLARTTQGRLGFQILRDLPTQSVRAWDFDAMRLDVQRPMYSWSLLYFDGGTALPGLAPEGANIHWTGTPHNSISQYDGPALLEFDVGPVVLSQFEDENHCTGALVHLSDPVAPLFGGYYTLMSLGELVFPARDTENDIIGRSSPMIISDVRRAPKGSVVLLTYTLEERDRLRTLLASGRTLVLRMPPDFGDPVLYVAAKDAPEKRVVPDVRRPERSWDIPIQVTDRPSGLVDLGLSTWRSVVDTNATWRDVKAKYATWLDLILGSVSRVNAPFGTDDSRDYLVVRTDGGALTPPNNSWYGSGYHAQPRYGQTRGLTRAVGK